MPDKVVLYAKSAHIATITLNRPEKFNTLRTEVLDGLRQRLAQANRDPQVRIIVLEGNGDAFCAGFDFSGGLDHFEAIKEENYDPGMDMHWVTNQYTSYITTFMGLWQGLKPTIAKVHGYCVGGGSELALCADLVVASDCARFDEAHRQPGLRQHGPAGHANARAHPRRHHAQHPRGPRRPLRRLQPGAGGSAPAPAQQAEARLRTR